MKKSSQLLVLLLSLVLVFTLASCQVEEAEQVIKQREKPEYVLTKEIYKDANEEVYGTVDYIYDEEGNVLRITSKDEKGEIIGDREYKYNKQGLLIERKVVKAVNYMVHMWISSSQAWNRVRVVQEYPMYDNSIAKYEYNKNGQLIKYDERDKNGEELRIIEIKYYKNGNKKNEYERRESGYEEKLIYNKDGNWVKIITKRNGGEKIEKADYDKQGRRFRIKSITKNKKGKIVDESISEKKYDDRGKIIKLISKSEDVVSGHYESHYEYQYDDKGNQIRTIRRGKEGNIKDIDEYNYDKNGNKILHINKNSDGSVWNKYEFFYDKYKNLIKTIKKNNNGKKIKINEYQYKKIR